MTRRASTPEGNCRSCGAAVIWVDYPKKHGLTGRMPVDADPVPAGNIQLFRRANGTVRAAILSKDEAANVKAAAHILGTEVNLRVSHFSSCPAAASWRSA